MSPLASKISEICLRVNMMPSGPFFFKARACWVSGRVISTMEWAKKVGVVHIASPIASPFLLSEGKETQAGERPIGTGFCPI